MSYELALVVGMGLTAWMTVKLLNEFKTASDMVEEAFYTLSMLFVIGLQYIGYGLADSNGFSKGTDAYIVALLVTNLLFIAVVIRLILNYRKSSEQDEFGYF